MGNSVPTIGKVSERFMGVLDPNESLSDGISSSSGVIKYKGKEWTLQYRGETYDFPLVEEDVQDKTGKWKTVMVPAIDVIIVRQARGKSKTYFEKYEEGSNDGPTCWSTDGITPDDSVPDEDKQCTACAVCPLNALQTNPQGFKSKPCSDYKRIAVLLKPDITEEMLGSPLMEPVFLRVPASSLSALSQYGDKLQRADNTPYMALFTRIGFEKEKSYPRFTFRPMETLADDNVDFVLEMRDDPAALRIVGEGRPQMRQIAAPVEQPKIEPPKPKPQPSFRRLANGNGAIEPTEIVPPLSSPPPHGPRHTVAAKPVEREYTIEVGETTVQVADGELDSRLDDLENL